MADKFVDFSAANNGDGTAYTQAASTGAPGAYNTLVGIAAPASGDFLWIRRAGSLALAAQLAPAWPGVHVVGWPIATDSYYASRPSAARTTWDADTANSSNGRYWVKITSAATANNFAPTGAVLTLHGIWFDSSLTSAGTTPIGNFTGAGSIHENLQFTYSGAVNGTSATLACYSNTGTNPKLIGTLYCKGSSTGTNAQPICKINSGASDGFAQNITVDCAFLGRGSSSVTTDGALSLGNTAGNKSLSVQNVAINQLAISAQHQGTALLLLSGSTHVNDVTVTGQAGNSFEGPGVVLLGSDCEILNLKGVNTVGCILNAGSTNLVEAKGWMENYPMVVSGATASNYGTGGITPNLVIASLNTCFGNTFLISNAVLAVSAAGPKIGSLGSDNVCILNHTDYVQGAIYKTGSSSQFDYEVFSMNHGRVLGAWAYENRHGTYYASNTYRSGGSNFSIRGAVSETDFGQNRRAMLISTKGRESTTINLVSGTNTITLYGAYKNYAGTNETAPNRNDIGFTFDYFDNTNAFQSVSTLTNDGTALTSDTSTWVNDSGLTPFKVAVTLSNCLAQTVAVNIIASPEGDAAGYFYIDPALVVS